MHNLVAELEQLTLQLVEHIETATNDDLLRFVSQRGVLIHKIQELADKSHIADGDRARLERITEYDAVIISKMNSLKNLAAYELNKVITGRIQKKRYEEVHLQPDGVFFDKKK